jgi:hypothetical protein
MKGGIKSKMAAAFYKETGQEEHQGILSLPYSSGKTTTTNCMESHEPFLTTHTAKIDQKKIM